MVRVSAWKNCNERRKAAWNEIYGGKDSSEETRWEGIIEKDVWNEIATEIENRLSVDWIPTGLITEKNNNIVCSGS